MQPLSKRRRRVYLYGLVAVFILCLPVVMFYANGYRFKSGIGFVRTGSVIVSISKSDAVLSLNGAQIGTSGFLRHNFYVDNLAPGSYQVLVTREGDHPWHRTLIVEEELVTDAQVLLVPLEVTSVRLIDATKAASSTAATTTTPHATYEKYRKAFLPSNATSTPIVALHKPTSEIIAVKSGNLSILWTDAEVIPPSRFCPSPSDCASEILIEGGKQNTISAEFFGGGVVYTTKEGGIFFEEIDIRPEPLSVQLYPVRGADFRVVDGRLIVKDANVLYEITGL